MIDPLIRDTSNAGTPPRHPDAKAVQFALSGAQIGRYTTDCGDGQAPQSDWSLSWGKPA